MVVDWIEPNGWTGPDPALYWSFDTPEHLTLMEGTQESKFATLVSGKVNIPRLNNKVSLFSHSYLMLQYTSLTCPLRVRPHWSCIVSFINPIELWSIVIHSKWKGTKTLCIRLIHIKENIHWPIVQSTNNNNKSKRRLLYAHVKLAQKGLCWTYN